MNRIELMGMASDVIENNMFSVNRFDLLPTLTTQMPRVICNGMTSAVALVIKTYHLRCLDEDRLYVDRLHNSMNYKDVCWVPK